jgi:threonine synthase
VSDGEIIAGIPRLARATGVFAEPAAAASLAGLMKLGESGLLNRDERVLLVITGNGLKDVDAVRNSLEKPLRVAGDVDLDYLRPFVSAGQNS